MGIMASKNGKRDGEFPSQVNSEPVRLPVNVKKLLELTRTLGDYSSVAEVISGLVDFVAAQEGSLITPSQMTLRKNLLTAKEALK
jgi:hypothetical protein